MEHLIVEEFMVLPPMYHLEMLMEDGFLLIQMAQELIMESGQTQTIMQAGSREGRYMLEIQQPRATILTVTVIFMWRMSWRLTGESLLGLSGVRSV